MFTVLLLFTTDDDGHIIRDRKAIVINYLSFWFWIDAMSSLPWDLIFNNIGLRAIKLVKVRCMRHMQRHGQCPISTMPALGVTCQQFDLIRSSSQTLPLSVPLIAPPLDSSAEVASAVKAN